MTSSAPASGRLHSHAGPGEALPDPPLATAVRRTLPFGPPVEQVREPEPFRSTGAYYEFFAGGGMARAGLGPQWRCLFANDFDRKKAAAYERNWGGDAFRCDDLRNLTTADLPGIADLAWASFPCQDLSLAGEGAGLRGERSGTFWPFWELMTSLRSEGRGPSVIVLENVCGTLSSHGGRDFAAIASALGDGGYRGGALVKDAVLFVPQSRPRLFVVAVRDDVRVPGALMGIVPEDPFHPRALRAAFGRLPPELRANWIWWRLAAPPARTTVFADLVEKEPADVRWHTAAETNKLLGSMNRLHRSRVLAAQASGRRVVGTAYRRTRRDRNGNKVLRTEVRFDGVAGCLRTPSGGSSRQLVLFVEGSRVRSRLMSARETARLMGLPEEYRLPERYNEAYHLTGDGLVVPVVRRLARWVIEPVARSAAEARALT